ncbi:uncharacterized protein LOC143196476 [Rhynchophorus ferrugineus]|uniref:uncharacterized protein LOC143196476 n=1 Tax=Rhynchophorus ferrugineus TaxID=354439 RepID=UPI003FCCE755
MKRPPGLWIFLAAGFFWLSLQDVDCIRATSLIFGKQSTTTTTEAPSADGSENDEETVSKSEQSTSNNSTSNSTDPVLSGNPQIDYIYDPNLPKELNGYNLSEYPFYERVPEEIDFKCDGLHDGFYASVPHKCQVYHHCLFGTRYDFLCANYTAFDQKTFICHFVSEVDCQNSKKFWHRNDALYKAQSTTTTASPLRAVIYTTAPPLGDPATPLPAAPRRPVGGRRPYRPNRRRRPQYDYYEDEYYDDDYYDDRPRSNRGRKRPRPRPRPVFDDDYEEYEDERYESRRGSSRRRPYRDRRRNKDRRKQEYDDDDIAAEDDDLGYKRQKNDDRRKRPLDDYDEPERDRKPSSDRKSSRKGSRRPASDEYDDDVSADYEDRPRKRNKETNTDGRPIIKPSTGTIYDRPRVAPRINLPVPKNAAEKYSYKNHAGGPTTTTTTTTAAPEITDEDEELEYEEPTPKRPRNRDRRPPSDNKRDKDDVKPQPSSSRPRNRKPEPPRNRYRPSLKRKPSSEEYYDDAEEENQDDVKKIAGKPSTTTTTTTTTTTELPRKEPIMRIVKRPFLPSRGGNPYSPRGLQPVGLKASDQGVEEEEDYSDEKQEEEEKQAPPPPRKPFKPSPVIVKVPRKPDELIDLEPSRPQTYIAPRTTQKPRLKSPDLLDLNEYDVTLNDALNPTLPNLPIRAFPVGFTTSADYYQRPRYVETGSHNRGGFARPAQTQAILSGY